MKLVDTHCHIHSSDYGLPIDEVMRRAEQVGVGTLVCVGNDLDDSQRAVAFVKDKDNYYATIGLHPHEASRYVDNSAAWQTFSSLVREPKVVAVGECGLDYYYEHSPKEDQKKILRQHIELAIEHDLPLIFHVRDAFLDFWKIFDEYRNVRGVVHSFTAARVELEQALERDLYIGLNGIMTFSKDAEHTEVTKAIPADRLLLETDAPFLTPVPKRGTLNEPANVSLVCEYLAHVRSIDGESLADQTSSNAQRLFAF